MFMAETYPDFTIKRRKTTNYLISYTNLMSAHISFLEGALSKNRHLIFL